jgi:hypothetical protein
MAKRAQKIADTYNKGELQALIAAKKREILKAAKDNNTLLQKNLTGELNLIKKALALKAPAPAPTPREPVARRKSKGTHGLKLLQDLETAGDIFRANAIDKYKGKTK